MVFGVFFYMHDAAATRGQYLALSKAWWSCFRFGSRTGEPSGANEKRRPSFLTRMWWKQQHQHQVCFIRILWKTNC